MKKIVIDRAGSYDQLKIRDCPHPRPGKGELLIETRACGVNFADCVVRMGLYSSAKEFVGWPITPGFEVAGTVAEIGEGVTQFAVGQKVIALTLFGGYATHLLVPENQTFALPAGLSFAQAAAIPAVFLTAYYALFELAHPKKGEWMLVHSAAGGVGSSLVQLGKRAGCRVVGVVGAAHKVAYAAHLGAETVIDKSSQELWREAEKLSPQGYAHILDANGAETLKQDYEHLSRGGKLVVYGFHSMFSKGRGRPNWIKMIWDYWRTPRFNPLQMTRDNRSVLAFNLSYMFGAKELLKEAMDNILQGMREGSLEPPQIHTYPLEQVAEAHRALESGQTVGKLVLTI